MSESARLAFSIGGALLVLAVLVFSGLPIPASFTSAARTATTPLWEMKNNVVGAVYGAFLSLDSKQALITDNLQLREEASQLRGEAFQAKLLEHENQKLKELLGRTTKASDKTLLGAILRTVDMAPYDALIVDVGADDGVTRDDLVTAQGDIAIGSVRDVFASTATVVLFSAPKEKTMVLVSGATSTIPVVAEGLGGGTLSASLPRAAGVKEGDSVFLAGLNSVVFGHVEKLVSDPASPFIEVLFRSPVNINDVQYVLIKRGSVWKPNLEAVETIKTQTATDKKSDDKTTKQ